MTCRAELPVGVVEYSHLCELPADHAGPHRCESCNYSWTVLR